MVTKNGVTLYIIEHIEANGYTAAEIESIAYLDPHSVQSISNSDTIPLSTILFKLADILEIDVNEFKYFPHSDEHMAFSATKGNTEDVNSFLELTNINMSQEKELLELKDLLARSHRLLVDEGEKRL